MDQSYAAYAAQRQRPSRSSSAREQGPGGGVGTPWRLIGAGVWTALVLLLGVGLHLFAALAATFDVARTETIGAVARRFWADSFAGEYLFGLVVLCGALVPIAALARRGGGRFGAFLAGGLGGLLIQVLACGATVASTFGGPGALGVLAWALIVAAFAAIVAIPVGLVGWAWGRTRRGGAPQ